MFTPAQPYSTPPVPPNSPVICSNHDPGEWPGPYESVQLSQPSRPSTPPQSSQPLQTTQPVYAFMTPSQSIRTFTASTNDEITLSPSDQRLSDDVLISTVEPARQEISNTNPVRSWYTRWFVDWWLMEILSWCFSAVCMVIIAIVLCKYDGKQVPDWRLGFSISAFVSILSGFAKSALLLPTAEALGQLKWDWFRRSEKRVMDFERLDSASRGAWGSFVLLAQTRQV
jgi:hypothetical protein